MPMPLSWDDAEEIALELMEHHPGIDPLTVRFTDLRQWVIGLPDFADTPERSNEGILEAIQMAWHEEFEDARE
jgi:FeS assembly protein IscX